MIRLSKPGTFCGDCTPKGGWVALYPTGRPNPRMGTSRGDVAILNAPQKDGDPPPPLRPNQNVLYPVCADIGETLCFAGSGGTDDHAWLWNGAKWIRLVLTYGVSACAFGPYGLYVSTPGTVDNVKVFDPLTGMQTGSYTKPIGAGGFASVEGLGLEGLHPQDEWYGVYGLGQFVMTGGYVIGQGTVHDGLKVANFGMLIERGLCQFNRVHHLGAQFAIASWLSDGEGRTEFLWPVVYFSALTPEVA